MIRQTVPFFFWVLFFLSLNGLLPTEAQENFDHVQIQTHTVTKNIYMLEGAGGNIGVCVGENGVFLVDDQFAPLTEKIQKAVAQVSEKPIRFLLNTHWHFDHTGGNENLGKAGAVIVAHENVRQRMSTEQFMKFFDRRVPAAPDIALPVITFTTEITFHLNGETIEVYHPDPAHTDGDAIVFFRTSNVVHMGDIYFEGLYPFIDLDSKGSIDGVIQAVHYALGQMDGETKVIPGHGPLSNKENLTAYVAMLETIRDRVKKMVAEKKTLEEVIASKPTADLDAKYGNGFMKPDQFVTLVYKSLSTQK